MGGTIAVSIRRADGREHRQARWTNPLSHLFLHLGFIEGDDSYLDGYIARWDEMRADWIDNNITGNYRLNMTPCYGDWTHLAPTGYGLVVVDYKNKVVLHSQGYSALTEFLGTAFLEDSVYMGVEEWPEPHVVALVKSGRVSRSAWDNDAKDFIAHGKLTDWREETTRKAKVGYPENMGDRYPVDMGDWTFERFGESGNDLTKMWNRLVDLGFEFNEEEEAAWDEFIAERREDDEEE